MPTTVPTMKTAAAKTTIRAIVVKSWSTESLFGVSYFFRLRPVNGSPDGSDDFASMIPANIIASSPCGERGSIHSLVVAEVELTGRWEGKPINFSIPAVASSPRGERRLSNPRGRVVKLTPAMAAKLAEEQELDAFLKAQWAKEGA